MASDRRRRVRRLSIRARLTWTYTALLVASALIVLAVVWVVLAIIPGYEFTYGPYPSGFMPIVNVEGKDDVLRLFALASIPAVLIVGVLGWLVSYAVAARVLEPLSELTATARSIDEKSLNTRLSVTGPNDEIKALADTFDSMLSRLETSFDTNSRFASNAAHELGTPLATTKTILQVARRQNPALFQADGSGTTLSRLEAVNDQMIAITSALLGLTSSAQSPLNDEVDLVALVDTALAENESEIATRGLSVSRSAREVTVAGDEVLLARAVSNLIRNAVVHNRDGGSIDVSVAQESGMAVVTVSNTGADLSGVDLGSLTEPFVRVAQRVRLSARRTEGHGLGLALVASIAEMHGAELALHRNSPDGLRVALSIPSPGASDRL